MSLPERGDAVEQWLQTQHEAAAPYVSDYIAIGGLLDTYRLHADTCTPLDQHVCHAPCDCYDDTPPA